MDDKSFVSLEQAQCPVCGRNHDTGAVLLDRRLKQSLERYTVTHLGMCPDCTKRKDDGYIALVEIDPSKSSFNPDKTRIMPASAYRTGEIAWLRKETFERVMNVSHEGQPMVFVDIGVIAALKEKTGQ